MSSKTINNPGLSQLLPEAYYKCSLTESLVNLFGPSYAHHAIFQRQYNYFNIVHLTSAKLSHQDEPMTRTYPF